ncbi:hypothetical protein [Dokdonella sp.]|uniref:hypothetical protein n=1 Tax=Dokdonella sp. TaxID=2291710 RepID=UPI001B113275|nr:hypothetical protein [Dokdonella sp.]MBO9664570.1 hypothetical protein [Dokdonella sp.]
MCVRFQRLVFFCWMSLAAVAARAATGSLTVFDDADENGFNRFTCAFGNGARAEQDTVHSGTTAIGVTLADFNSVCWQAPAVLSRLNDYRSISLWVNAGPSAPQDLRFLLYRGEDIVAKIDLVTVYGAPLPASTWIPLRISLSDLVPDPNAPADPSLFDDVVIRTYTMGAGGADRFFVDDVVLLGTDIFEDGFDG